jgi:hypothetical protein
VRRHSAGPLDVGQAAQGCVSTLLPDRPLFLYAYVRKEAVLSSQIEGTQSSLSDLLLFELEEAPGAPLDDVVEVSNYVGLGRLVEPEIGEPILARDGRDPVPLEARWRLRPAMDVHGAVPRSDHRARACES